MLELCGSFFITYLKFSNNCEGYNAVESLEPVEPLSLFGDQRISYNYMNLPVYKATDNDSIEYTYGVGNNPIKARQYYGGQLLRTTWYGDNFERVVEGSTEKFYHWIQSPDGPVALVIKVTGGATTIYYLCTDHLNSTTGVMNSTGSMQEEYSYDPWGRRRSPVNWSTTSVTMPMITNRGFTGHEHLDAFSLIHMNGRLYEPHLARVLNSDPMIQEPLNIQNYNRYSYCLNNPLKYIDPSGYGWLEWLKKLFRSYGCKTPTGRTQKARETELADFYNWLQGIGGGGSAHGGGGGSVNISDMSGVFTYIPGISTYNPVPYTSSFSRYGGGSGSSGSYHQGSGGSIQGPAYTIASSDGGWKFLSLGNGKPYLTYQVNYSNNFDKHWGTDFELNIRVYGKQYSDYNWVQTYTYNNKPGRDGNYNGFMYSTDQNNSWRKAWADQIQGDANMFFHDAPNALNFHAELSLVGRIMNGWEVIQSFSWGFNYSNGVMTPYDLIRITYPSEYHNNYLYDTLRNH